MSARKGRLLAALHYFSTEGSEGRPMNEAPKGVGWSTIDDLIEAGLLEKVGDASSARGTPFRTTQSGACVLDAEDPSQSLPRQKRWWQRAEFRSDHVVAPQVEVAEEPSSNPRKSRSTSNLSRLKTEPIYPPRGMNRVDAARYVGIGVSKFDDLVRDGRMPKPKRIDRRNVWDRLLLDEAFDALPEDGDTSEDRRPWHF